MPVTPDKHLPETVLAFDFGRRRIGIAVGQEITASASALGTVTNGANGPDWARIDTLLAEWQPARLIVGLPLLPDGSPSTLDDDIRAFRAALARYALPVESVDETYSSVEASERLISLRRDGLRGRIRKEAIDAAAAVLIAERWLSRNQLRKPADSE
jgi:putative Holliday junction resolvase